MTTLVLCALSPPPNHQTIPGLIIIHLYDLRQTRQPLCERLPMPSLHTTQSCVSLSIFYDNHQHQHPHPSIYPHTTRMGMDLITSSPTTATTNATTTSITLILASTSSMHPYATLSFAQPTRCSTKLCKPTSTHSHHPRHPTLHPNPSRSIITLLHPNQQPQSSQAEP